MTTAETSAQTCPGLDLTHPDLAGMAMRPRPINPDGLCPVRESIWGRPNRSFYRFLAMVETSGLPKTLCVLGCSDGKFVIPAAKKGFTVLAIDIDTVALYGGEVDLLGELVHTVGMQRRLETKGLRDKVLIVNQSYLQYVPTMTYSGVFTSGSIHYAQNAGYPLEEVVRKIQSFVSPGGFLFQEYIHTSESDNDPGRHFLDKKRMAAFFNAPQWDVVKHRKKRYIEGPNPRNNQVHDIVWGSMLARKNYQ